jgi:uncharacterized protein with HEPN domain
MSPRGWQERIQDILDAIAEIQSFVTNTRFEEFQDDLKTMRAVELDLIIIGEAANTIPEEVQEAHPEIAWHLMRGMRNRLVHTYFSVSPKLLWDTIHQDLPPLAKALVKLLP